MSIGNYQIPSLIIPTVEGGLLCHQEISREAARRKIDCPMVISAALSSYSALEVVHQIRTGNRKAAVDTIILAIVRLHLAGATFAAITANLLHLIFDEISAHSPLPLISIVDVVAAYAKKLGVNTVGLLGTSPIMENDLYPKVLKRSGIQVIVPDDAERNLVNQTIFDELLAGVVTPESRERMETVARNLRSNGAQAIALCCTELGMVLDDSFEIPVMDSTKLLAHAVLDRSIA